MINRDKTKLKYGHTSDNLAPNSTLKVVWNCDRCPAERSYTYAYYLKKKNKAFAEQEGDELCQKCSHSHRIGKTEKTTVIKYAPVTLPPEVNIEESIKIFGNDPSTMSPWSRNYLILNCGCCNKETETRRCSLNTYKSILSDGHFKCTGCWTKERRQGVKASEETIEKQKLSQQQRRRKEQNNLPPQEHRYKAVGNGDFNSNNQTNQTNAKIIPFPKKG